MSVYKTPLMESQDLESLDLAKTQTAQNTQSGRRHSTQAAVVFNPVGASPISHTLELDMPKIDITDMNYSTAQMIEDINKKAEKEYEEALREFNLRLRDNDFVHAPKEFWLHGEWTDARNPRVPVDIEQEFDVTNINDRAAIAYVKVTHRWVEKAPFSMALMNAKSVDDGAVSYAYGNFMYLLNEEHQPGESGTQVESLSRHITKDVYLKIKVPGTMTYRIEYDEHGEFVGFVPAYQGPEYTIDITAYTSGERDWFLEIGSTEIVDQYFGRADNDWAVYGFKWYYERPYNTNKINVTFQQRADSSGRQLLNIESFAVCARYITLHLKKDKVYV